MAPPAANAAIYFVPEAFSTAGERLMGRNAAGEAFLRAWMSHARVDQLAAFVPDPAFGPAFQDAVRALRPRTEAVVVAPDAMGHLAAHGALFFPSPGLGPLAWRREWFVAQAWSLVGITHTTASAAVMDSIAELPTTPTQPWDAMICTSSCVADTVETVLSAQFEFLARRLGSRGRPPMPKFPVIPLGVHCRDFDYSQDDRVQARAALGVAEHDLVVLFVGRLSFHAKAHPLAMYQALQRAARELAPGRKVVLVECGWHANEAIRAAFTQAQRIACPDVRTVWLDGRLSSARKTAWAGADVFCSLSDNIQETFGLAPLEAMAAGLPVVVSDWDGYRDTVRDGIDGFRVQTMAPPAGFSPALPQMLERGSYDRYCGEAAMMVAVDIDAAAQAFLRLFTNADLRRTMGEAGRRRARSVFDWSIIIRRYQDLIAELAEIRLSAPRRERHLWPARLDTFLAFRAYPTATLSAETRLEGGAVQDRSQIDTLRGLEMVKFASLSRLTPEELDVLLHRIRQGSVTARALADAVAPERRDIFVAGLVQLVKLGILKVSEPIARS